LWTREYGGRPDIVGKRLRLNAREFTIVGIAPKDFTGVETFVQPEIYVPRMMARALAGGATNSFLTDRSARITPVLARLKPGVGIQQARDEMARIGSQLEQEHPESNRGYKLGVLSQLDYKVTQSPDNVTMAVVFMIVAGLVLGIACVNVINLVLSTLPARTGEMALKVALGASRSRLARQLLVESVLVSIGGSIGGLAIAMACARLISSIRIASLLPLTLDTRVDYRVVIFGFATGIAAGILSGLIPALRIARGSVNVVLRTTDSRLGRSGRMWMRRGMVVAQMSLALVVLVMSGLFIQDMRLSRRMDPGFRVTNVLTAGFDPAGNGRDVTQTLAFYNELLEKTRAIPGVQAAGLSQHIPLGVSSSNADLSIDGYQPPDPRGGDASIQVSTATVSEGYFEALAIPIMRGRTFDVHDTNDAPKVAIINEAMAEKYWPTSDAIGSKIRLRGADGGIAEIVGIARTSKYRELSEKPLPFLYLPQRQGSRSFMILFVATEGDSIDSLPAIRRAAAEIDADVPLYDVRTMSDHFQQQALWGARLVANVMTAVAVVGLFLGALGLYGILAYSVSERTHEIGIRMAIGASKRDVLRMILSQGIWLTAIGTVIGLTLMLALNGVTKQLVTTMNPLDPSLYAIVIGVLLAVTLLACYIPARRAATVDPNRALRSE
jgi:predicted permease